MSRLWAWRPFGVYMASGLVLSLNMTPTVYAEYRTGGIDFSLHYQHTREDWRYAAMTLRTRISRLGINWYEGLAARLQGGFKLGYLDISQPDNNLAAARVTTGHYGGLMLRGLLLMEQTYNLGINLDYSYQDTQSSLNGQQVNLIWRQIEAGLGFHWQMLSQTQLRLATIYTYVDGEQRTSGPVTQTTLFESASGSGYSVGLDYQVDRSGHIGVQWLAGNRDGVHIYFTRLF